MTDTIKTSVGKLAEFSGNQEDFITWRLRSNAVLACNEVLQYCGTTKHSSLPRTEESTDVSPHSDAQKLAVKRNSKAVAMLVQAFKKDSLLLLYHQCCTSDWPTGLASDLMKRLQDRYQPNDALTGIELEQAIQAIKDVSATSNPEVLFDAIDRVAIKFATSSVKLTESQKEVIIWQRCQKVYANVLTSLRINYRESLTTDLMRQNILDEYRSRHGWSDEKKGNDDDSDSGDQALAAFTGNCNKCGKKGHKERDCRLKKNNNNNNNNRNNNNGGNRINGSCNNCGKPGHKAVDCFDKPENAAAKAAWFKKIKGKERNNGGSGGSGSNGGGNRNQQQANAGFEFVCMAVNSMSTVNNDSSLWISDSACTRHITNNKVGLSNTRLVGNGDGVKGINGELLECELIGDLKGIVCNQDGKELYTTLMKPVQYSKTAYGNLFSEAKMIKEGWSITKERERTIMKKGEHRLVFDIPIHQGGGVMHAIRIKRDESIKNEVANAAIDIMTVHDRLGHPGQEMTKQVAAHLGWEVEGSMTPCASCAVGKARQKNIKREEPAGKADVPNGRVFVDCAVLKASDSSKKIKKSVWIMIVDEYSGLKHSYCCETKDQMPKIVCSRFLIWKNEGKPVKIVRMDNAGENQTLKELANGTEYNLGIKFELTAARTPQQNHLVEVGFNTIKGRSRALLCRANVPQGVRWKFMPHLVVTTTKLEGLAVITIDGVKQTRYEHWGAEIPAWAPQLSLRWGNGSRR
ncbi:hypothetical protein MPSEU_000078400 [Mayamaea pseudoterrestris]|nr:hypothetical protein MPSEU_000078400 [Mayamaea pseudoterrestris]